MRKIQNFICLLLMSSSLTSMGQVPINPDKQKKEEAYQKFLLDYNRHQKDYFEAYLKACDTNEIRSFYFLGDELSVREVEINLAQSSVATRRYFYDNAIQNNRKHNLYDHQPALLEKLVGLLPPSQEKVDYQWTLFFAVRKKGKVEIWTYDRRHIPSIVQRIYDVAGVELPEYTIIKLAELQHTPWEPTSIQILSNSAVSSKELPAFLAHGEVLTEGRATQSLELVLFVSNDKTKPYLGPKMDMYIQGSDKIIGFKLGLGDRIFWHENVLIDYPTTLTNALEITKSTTVSIDMTKLAEGDNKSTHLSPQFSTWAFTDGPFSSAVSQNVKITEASVETNLLKIKIENQASDFHGEAWIDLNTKEVVRGIESGKVVFLK